MVNRPAIALSRTIRVTAPTLRLTYKVRGKTVSEALPTPVAVRKAEHEIAEFRKFRELSRAFVEINEKICRLRPAEDAYVQ